MYIYIYIYIYTYLSFFFLAGLGVQPGPTHVLPLSHIPSPTYILSQTLPTLACSPLNKSDLRAGVVTQVVEHLPSRHKALGSIPSTTKKKKKEKKLKNDPKSLLLTCKE
jgi:hypothetical protein